MTMHASTATSSFPSATALVELARLETDVRQQRRILLPQAVGEAVRQLRDAWQSAGVDVRMGELPARRAGDAADAAGGAGPAGRVDAAEG